MSTRETRNLLETLVGTINVLMEGNKIKGSDTAEVHALHEAMEAATDAISSWPSVAVHQMPNGQTLEGSPVTIALLRNQLDSLGQLEKQRDDARSDVVALTVRCQAAEAASRASSARQQRLERDLHLMRGYSQRMLDERYPTSPGLPLLESDASVVQVDNGCERGYHPYR